MKNASLLALVLLAAAPFVGCAADYSDSETTAEAAAPPAAAPEPADPVRLAAVLTAADLADGVEDKTVSKCSGCALQMDGSAEHALQVEGYELHFCSDTCRDTFGEDAPGKLVAMELPEAP